MARVKWATDSVDKTNHNPNVVVNGEAGTSLLELGARAGEIITLNASGSGDPDGNSLDFHWFLYEEIFKPSAPLLLEKDENSLKVKFEFPDMPKGEAVHIILEVSDRGKPSLTSYRRIILTAL